MFAFWPMKTLDPDYLASKQFSKMAEGVGDFACFASSFVFTWVISIACVCACASFYHLLFFYLLVLASLMKTSLNLRKACYIATGVVEGAGF